MPLKLSKAQQKVLHNWEVFGYKIIKIAKWIERGAVVVRLERKLDFPFKSSNTDYTENAQPITHEYHSVQIQIQKSGNFSYSYLWGHYRRNYPHCWLFP